MISKLVSDAKLFSVLYLIDVDLAEQCRQLGCPYCGSALYFARYSRKPRGGPDSLPDEYLIRHSLCCSAEECRRRTLPASCLFMGRRVYWRGVILVVMALHQQRPNGVSIYRLKQMFAIDYKTVRRWAGYFSQVFPSSAQWKSLRGLVHPNVDDQRLPGSLLECFLTRIPDQRSALIACIEFISSDPRIHGF